MLAEQPPDLGFEPVPARPAGGTRGGVHPDHLLAGHREHPEGIVLAQVRLGSERELSEVCQFLAVVRVHGDRVEGGVVVRHVLTGMPQ